MTDRLETHSTIRYFQHMLSLEKEIQRIFSPTGRLATLEGFEYRPQQEEMARAVAEALESRTHLMVEAPTGVGKTLAYLIPSILHAIRQQRRAIISTHTKNLQEQLFNKDIPLVRSIISPHFQAEVLKGRRNYLCSTRLRNVLASPGSLFGSSVTEHLASLSRCESQSRDGDIETFPTAPLPEVWDLVCSEQGICTPASCGSSCSFQRLKERLRSAQVIIMNHALFFSLTASVDNSDRFIYDDDFVILDEAHTIPNVAWSGIGKRVSRHQVLTTINRLYNSRTRRGFLARQNRQLKARCTILATAAEEFFETVASRIRLSSSGASGGQTLTVRLRTPSMGSQIFDEHLTEMHRELQGLADSATNPAMRSELSAVARSLAEIQWNISEFFDQTEPAFTYWVELVGSDVVLCSSPVDVGEIIGPRLFKNETSVIMTSATLAVDNSLEYAKQRMGATDIRTLILDTPFDYTRQMRVLLAADIPQPDTEGYQDELPGWVLRSIEQSGGKALVLFTNAALMNAVALALRDPLADRGITLFVQGTDLARHELLEAFKTDVHSVLFGLDSFWMGVDVPGESLEHVIITRLPFAAPNHPLVEARLEAIARRGGQPFLESTLPDAILKFRQGVGRLIRSSTDRGMVTVLDSRLVHRSYGRAFINSVPRCPVEVMTGDGESKSYTLEDW